MFLVDVKPGRARAIAAYRLMSLMRLNYFVDSRCDAVRCISCHSLVLIELIRDFSLDTKVRPARDWPTHAMVAPRPTPSLIAGRGEVRTTSAVANHICQALMIQRHRRRTRSGLGSSRARMIAAP